VITFSIGPLLVLAPGISSDIDISPSTESGRSPIHAKT
jgi:hypothetical protein